MAFLRRQPRRAHDFKEPCGVFGHQQGRSSGFQNLNLNLLIGANPTRSQSERGPRPSPTSSDFPPADALLLFIFKMVRAAGWPACIAPAHLQARTACRALAALNPESALHRRTMLGGKACGEEVPPRACSQDLAGRSRKATRRPPGCVSRRQEHLQVEEQSRT